MNVKQIKSYITNLGYKLDEWSSFDKIPIIKFATEFNIFTDNNKLLKFNSKTNNLEIALGYWHDGVFINKLHETKDYTPNGMITFDLISGFVRSEGFNGVNMSTRLLY